MKKLLIFTTIFTFTFFIDSLCGQDMKVNWKSQTILVYTKNGKGYVHDNIPDAIAAIKRIGIEKGIKVEVSEDPSLFNDDNLQKYRFLLFASTNNDVFDTNEQRLAFRRYIEAGGGFLGIHSAIGTERNWTWFKQLCGGTFAWHPHFQKLTITKMNKNHISSKYLPDKWVKEDECYFIKEMYPSIKPILVHDLQNIITKDEGEKNNFAKHSATFGRFYPATWSHDYDGGLAFMTMLGHSKADYTDAIFIQHLYQGMVYLQNTLSKLDYKKAYAKSYDEEVVSK